MLGFVMSLGARSMRLALYAFCLLGLLSLALSVTATPIPLPLPLMAADYSLSPVSVNRSTPQVAARRLQSLPVISSVYSTELSRSLGGLGSLESFRDFGSLADLAKYSGGASHYANTLKNLAADSENVNNDDYDFQQDYVSSLSDFNTNVQGFQEAFAKASSDNGLANYDKQNHLEVLLKEFVNANKDALTATATAVGNIPGLGPVLGPIVYELKCLLDGILDLTEDLTDAVINFLGPPLQALLGKPAPGVCEFGAELLGLCL